MINYSQVLLEFFVRDLQKLETEISAYSSEENIWKTGPGISNSGGNLALHLIGNLNHFFGATLGGTGYVRDREAEFAIKNVPRSKIVADINSTIEMMQTVLGKLFNEDLDKEFPLQKPDQHASTAFFLTGFLAHLEYHLGQINYHRRLLDK